MSTDLEEKMIAFAKACAHAGTFRELDTAWIAVKKVIEDENGDGEYTRALTSICGQAYAEARGWIAVRLTMRGERGEP